MLTVLRVGRFRFFFYSSDQNEQMHAHIEAEGKIAKVWLDPIRLENSGGFNRSEITRILTIVMKHQVKLMESWNGYFSN